MRALNRCKVYYHHKVEGSAHEQAIKENQIPDQGMVFPDRPELSQDNSLILSPPIYESTRLMGHR